MVNKFKRLAIISDCIHMRDEHGNAVTENHIYCRQMQELAKHFEHTVIVCPFVQQTKDSVTSVYTLPSIEFIELPNAGGNTFKAKLQLLKMLPVWKKAFSKANKMADIVYLRMPNNLNIPGFFYFFLKKTKAFATYTGTWDNYKNEPLTYRFQKWLLNNFFEGPVWIYVDEQKKNTRLQKSTSPSYSLAEWNEETGNIARRIEAYHNSRLEKPVFITVGALVPNKNQQYILDTCVQLRNNGLSFYWYIVGDGYMKNDFESFIKTNALQNYVCLAGKKTYMELRALYREAIFLVQATRVEGFGKAPIEAMFHGVIPILSDTALSKTMTGNGAMGFNFDVSDERSLEQVIMNALGLQDRFAGIIEKGRVYVKEHTLESWAGDIMEQINLFYNK